MLTFTYILLPTFLLGGLLVLFCCESDSPGIFGLLHRGLSMHIPSALRQLLLFIPGGGFVLNCCCKCMKSIRVRIGC